MIAKDSEELVGPEGAFIEDDAVPTEMAYDEGGVPLYIALSWVVIIAAYIIYMVVYALPDFKLWGAP